jgi:hypothetical protein
MINKMSVTGGDQTGHAIHKRKYKYKYQQLNTNQSNPIGYKKVYEYLQE